MIQYASLEEMQAWAAVTLASRAPDFVIGPPESPYLRRWWMIPRNTGCNVYLHEILRSDDDRALHDHPWANTSMLLDGRYIEHTPDGTFKREAGWVGSREAEAAHRLEILPGERAVSLFMEITRQLALTVLRGDFVDAGKAARELDLKMRMMTGIAKARAVAAYVRLLLRDTPRVLLAGWHREVYATWSRELAEFQPVLYTGSESAAGKARSVEAFTTGTSRVMMISLRSGAGLDGLQHHCRDVVFGELDWSPQVHHQVIGRLRRPGQQDQVSAHYLHTAGGSDPVLLETLGVKRDQSRGINDPGAAPRAKFTDDSRIKRLAQHVLGLEPGAFAEAAE